MAADEFAISYFDYLLLLHLLCEIFGTETDARSQALWTPMGHHHLQRPSSCIQHLYCVQGNFDCSQLLDIDSSELLEVNVFFFNILVGSSKPVCLLSLRVWCTRGCSVTVSAANRLTIPTIPTNWLWLTCVGGIISANSPSSWTPSFSFCVKSLTKSPICMWFTTASCRPPFGGVSNSRPVATLRSSECSTPSFTSSCTRTTCWPPWAPSIKSTCGGRSIWRRCKWYNSSPSSSTRLNSSSSSATSQSLSPTSCASIPSCSSPSFPIFTFRYCPSCHRYHLLSLKLHQLFFFI